MVVLSLKVHDFLWKVVNSMDKLGDGRTEICSLPDDILQKISSLLTTKDAVKTSILSKRWENQRKSVPDLCFIEDEVVVKMRQLMNFLERMPLFGQSSNMQKFMLLCDAREDQILRKRGHFMNFVERVLLLRESSNIPKFMLSCDVGYDGSRINDWISAALRHAVQQLDLWLIDLDEEEEPLLLPHALFTRDSLTVLKIRMQYGCLELPASISFPRLKCYSPWLLIVVSGRM